MTNKKRIMITLSETNEKMINLWIKKYYEIKGVKVTYSQFINEVVFRYFNESLAKYADNNITEKEGD